MKDSLALAEVPSLVPSTQSGVSQMPVIPAPGDRSLWALLGAAFMYTHLHKHT